MFIEQIYQIYLQHRHITTDTRQIKPNNLFFALKGDRFDGNTYAAQALEKGASYVFIDNPLYKLNERCVLVDDVLLTLQALAQHHRKQLQIPIIGIAGSNGKTTTKELVLRVLASTYRTHATLGNLNNHIGVPLTLLAIPPNCEVAIIEIGANHPNEVAQLCQIAQPTHGLVTNIGKEHLEGFGSIEGVQKAEGELYDYLTQTKGTAFVNLDDHRVVEIAQATTQQITYGTQPKAFICGCVAAANPLLHITYTAAPDAQTRHLHTQIVGHYNLLNVLAAIAIGTHLGVLADDMQTAIETYLPANKRSQIIQQGSNTIILDAYNANPSSMQAALHTLAALDAPYKVAILGDMLEMGTHSLTEHQQIIAQLHQFGFNQVVLVGSEFAKADVPNSPFLHFATATDAQQWYAQQLFNHTYVLLKASRGIALEKVIEVANWNKTK